MVATDQNANTTPLIEELEMQKHSSIMAAYTEWKYARSAILLSRASRDIDNATVTHIFKPEKLEIKFDYAQMSAAVDELERTIWAEIPETYTDISVILEMVIEMLLDSQRRPEPQFRPDNAVPLLISVCERLDHCIGKLPWRL